MARVPCGARHRTHCMEFCAASVATRLPEAPTGRGGLVCESEGQRLAITGKLMSLVYDRFCLGDNDAMYILGPYCR